jgi:RNA polymerase sigma-70 factor (ECF subfamily)
MDMDTAARQLSGTAHRLHVVIQERSFEALYAEHFNFVWRNLQRLGVPAPLVEDAAQDVFVVVHRRLANLRADASPKAWLFGIALRIAHDYRRSRRRKRLFSADCDQRASCDVGPFEHAATAQPARMLERFLGTLDEDRRAVFALAELEQMSAPEMSEALGIGVNIISLRLRAARERFMAFLGKESIPHG